MEIIYGEDAVFFTAWIQRNLIQSGFIESAAECEEVLTQLESELPDIPRIAEELYYAKDTVGAFQRILWPMDESDWTKLRARPESEFLFPFPIPFPLFTRIPLSQTFGSIENATEYFRKSIENIDGPRMNEYWRLVREAAFVLQSNSYKSEAPLNVVAAIAVLHGLVVVPQLNFDELGRRMRNLVKANVVIVNDDGNVALDTSNMDTMLVEVQDFWTLFASVEEEFADAIGGPEQPGFQDKENQNPTAPTLAAMVGRQAKLISARVMAQIRQNRREA